MSRKMTFTCDVCGKTATADVGDNRPPGWVHVEVDDKRMRRLSTDTASGHYDACSAPCAIAVASEAPGALSYLHVIRRDSR